MLIILLLYPTISPHTKLSTSSVIHITDGENNMCNAVGTYAYDDFGHVITNNRSGAVADMTYEYDNLHGWVIGIKDSKGIFEQKLFRETGEKTPCFNGSISAIEWKTTASELQRYDFTYDGLNRLTWADYLRYKY